MSHQRNAAVGYLYWGSSPTQGEEGQAVYLVLLDVLGQHTPTIEPDPPDGCWLDLRTGGRRPPPPATLAAAVLASARESGAADARLGVAPTPGVARLAALSGTDNPTLLDAATVGSFLAPLPVACLGLDADTERRLALVGLHTLGDLAALPRGALGDYLGAAGPGLEALARGEDDRSLVPRRPPLVLTVRQELDYALADRAQLVALLGRLLCPLLATLRRQGLGVTRVTLTLRDTRGQRVEALARLPTPTSDQDAVLRPLLATVLDLLGKEDGADEAVGELVGFTAVALRLTAPRPLVGRQASFFDVPQGQRGRLHAGIREARRRGQGQLGYLRPVDPAHPLPERRYVLDDQALPQDDEVAPS